jgi:hypothetical protein
MLSLLHSLEMNNVSMILVGPLFELMANAGVRVHGKSGSNPVSPDNLVGEGRPAVANLSPTFVAI